MPAAWRWCAAPPGWAGPRAAGQRVMDGTAVTCTRSKVQGLAPLTQLHTAKDHERERRGSTAPIWGLLLTTPVSALRAARPHPNSTHPDAVAVVLDLQQGLAAILARHAAGMGEGRPAAAGCMPCREQAGICRHVACAHQQGCVQPLCASPLTQSVSPLHPGCSPASPSARWRGAAVGWVAGGEARCVSGTQKQQAGDG